jgi:hypothetical protein
VRRERATATVEEAKREAVIYGSYDLAVVIHKASTVTEEFHQE